MYTQTINLTLVKQTCITCGMVFGIEEDFDSRLRKTHGSFCCPSGHFQHYATKTEEEKLRSRLSRIEARASRLQDEVDTAERRRRGQKAANTRLRRKIASGECPSCGKHFSDVKKHIAEKHPNFGMS